jgi:hypothetical protein
MTYELNYRVYFFLNQRYKQGVISWLSVLLVEETGVPGENDRPPASH